MFVIVVLILFFVAFFFYQAIASSSLGKLIRGLPDTLRRQYEYEEQLVRGGKHLFHSDFFKVNVLKPNSIS